MDEQTNKQLSKSKNKQSSKSERKACLVCNVTVDETDGIRWKRVWFCKRCHDSKNFNLDGNCIRLSNNEILIQGIYTSGLCPIPTSVLDRLEKSPDFSPIVKRTSYYAIDRILAYLNLETTRKKRMTKWIYEGNKSIYDDFDSGYTAHVSLDYSDVKLRKIITGILRQHGFGCLVSEHSVLGHKNNDSPQEEEIDKLINSITTKINETELEYNEPDWTERESSTDWTKSE
jgi:hypothetical protein